jgi:hypothetical protein
LRWIFGSSSQTAPKRPPPASWDHSWFRRWTASRSGPASPRWRPTRARTIQPPMRFGAGRDATARCSSDRGRCTCTAPMASTGAPTWRRVPRGWGILFRGGEIVHGLGVARSRRGRQRDLANGPGKLTQALAVDHSHDGTDLFDGSSPIRLEVGPTPPLVMATPRVGISQAIDRPWRFVAVAPVTGGGRSPDLPGLPSPRR